MKKLILFLFFMIFVGYANAGTVVIYDTTTYRVESYRVSVNTPDYTDRIDVLINPDVSLLNEIPIIYWKYDSGNIVEMTQEEKDTIDTETAEAIELGIRNTTLGYVDDFNDVGLIIRALAEVIRKEVNILRAEHSLSDRTLEQLKTQITSEINSGNVD